MLYSLDSFDKNGEAGKGGTTGIFEVVESHNP